MVNPIIVATLGLAGGAAIGGVIGYFMKPTSAVLMTQDPPTSTGSAGTIYLVKNGEKHAFASSVWDPYTVLYPKGTYPTVAAAMVADGTLKIYANVSSIKDGFAISSWKQFFEVLGQ